MTAPSYPWPEGKRFAFTVFDDPDSQTLETGRIVYSFLRDLGFRTTKGIWPVGAFRIGNSRAETCDNPLLVEHALELRSQGFEIGFHGASHQSSTRAETEFGLDRFRELFGADPAAMANHFDNAEAIYWGAARLSGWRRLLYSATTTFRMPAGRYSGELPESPFFWGDLCRSRIRYCRNFVFRNINTLGMCPQMPYHDPMRPFVQQWYAGSEGADAPKFIATIAEREQDRLHEEGGACIMYTHFGKGFVENGRLLPAFERLMTRLSRKGGWFVPVSELLDFIEARRGPHVLSARDRARLESRWLREKLLRGTA